MRPTRRDFTVGSVRGLLSLLAFLKFTFLRFHLGLEIVFLCGPKTGEEIIEGSDARNVPGLKTAENGVERNTVQFIDPFGNADFLFAHEKEQIGTQHRRGITGSRASIVIEVVQE